MSRAEALRYIIAANIARQGEDECECMAGPDQACQPWCGLTNDDEDSFWRDLDRSWEEYRDGRP